MKKPVPVIGLAGFSGSGKTTFLEKLIVELKRRGYRLGVIKHTHHTVELDQPGKDTWRHARAGADVVALATPGGVALVKKFETEPGPEAIIAMMGNVDLILIEGYKRGKWPKIEVYCREVSERVAIPREELLAVVGNRSAGEEVPCFRPEDAAGVAGLIERVFPALREPGRQS